LGAEHVKKKKKKIRSEKKKILFKIKTNQGKLAISPFKREKKESVLCAVCVCVWKRDLWKVRDFWVLFEFSKAKWRNFLASQTKAANAKKQQRAATTPNKKKKEKESERKEKR
jgi:hypothetical protein